MKQQTKHAHHLVESFLIEESKKICSVFLEGTLLSRKNRMYEKEKLAITCFLLLFSRMKI
jgi:hypothetical protein